MTLAEFRNALRILRSVDMSELQEDDALIPMGQKCTLLQLTEKTCRWPIGNPGSPDFFFCGGASDNTQGRPYCPYHSRVAYRPVNQRDSGDARRRDVGTF